MTEFPPFRLIPALSAAVIERVVKWVRKILKMKTQHFLVLTAIAALSAPAAYAGSFNDQQFQDFDHLVGSVIAGVSEDPEHIDSMLEAVQAAYVRSPFGKDEAAQAVRQKLISESEKVKKAISNLQGEVAERRARDRDPAVMLLLLSKEQTASFILYKWCRSAAELADAANLVAGKSDPAAEELFSGMNQVNEGVQDTVGTAIQVIADRFLDH